jgi:hypothetical protein
VVLNRYQIEVTDTVETVDFLEEGLARHVRMLKQDRCMGSL